MKGKRKHTIHCYVLFFNFSSNSLQTGPDQRAPYASIMWIYLQTTLHKLTAAFVVIYGKIQPDIETMVG